MSTGSKQPVKPESEGIIFCFVLGHAVNFCEVKDTNGFHLIFMMKQNTLIFEAITGFPFFI